MIIVSIFYNLLIFYNKGVIFFLFQNLCEKCVHISSQRNIFHRRKWVHRLGKNCSGKYYNYKSYIIRLCTLFQFKYFYFLTQSYINTVSQKLKFNNSLSKITSQNFTIDNFYRRMYKLFYIYLNHLRRIWWIRIDRFWISLFAPKSRWKKILCYDLSFCFALPLSSLPQYLCFESSPSIGNVYKAGCINPHFNAIRRKTYDTTQQRQRFVRTRKRFNDVWQMCLVSSEKKRAHEMDEWWVWDCEHNRKTRNK